MKKNESMPCVTIITPSYNHSQYIEELILSIKNQDYPNIEHYIIDDGSTDNGNTISILKKYPHLRWKRRKNIGQYGTMNEGLLEAQGEIISFFNADDIMAPNSVSAVVSYLLEHPTCDAVYGNTFFFRGNGYPAAYQIPIKRFPSLYPYLHHIPHCSIYIRRNILIERELFFDTSFRFCSDFDWMIRILKNELRIGYIGRYLSHVRLHSQQATVKFNSLMKPENLQIIEHYHFNRYLQAGIWRLFSIMTRSTFILQNIKRHGIKDTINLIIKRVKNGSL